MGPKFTVRIGVDLSELKTNENFRMIRKRHKASWPDNGKATVWLVGDDLNVLMERTELFTNDLKAAKIKVRRIQVVETILDVEEE